MNLDDKLDMPGWERVVIGCEDQLLRYLAEGRAPASPAEILKSYIEMNRYARRKLKEYPEK